MIVYKINTNVMVQKERKKTAVSCDGTQGSLLHEDRTHRGSV